MLDDLVLLRVWAGPDPVLGETRSKVADDLRAVAADPSQGEAMWRTTLAEAVARLTATGDLAAGGRQGARLRLTDQGRQRVRTRFHLPKAHGDHGTTRGWAWWRDHYALPLALGGRQAGTATELRAALLQRLYLPELSLHPSAGGLQKTVDLLLAKRLKVSQVSLGAFRMAALRGWLAQADAPAPAPANARRDPLPEHPALFAQAVTAAAYRSPTGRFGDKKVFVAHVWRELLGSGQAAPGELDAFKRRLIRANTAGQLRLSRADLAGAHDPGDVRASEIEYLGEKFHFVRLD